MINVSVPSILPPRVCVCVNGAGTAPRSTEQPGWAEMVSSNGCSMDRGKGLFVISRILGWSQERVTSDTWLFL